MAFQVIIKRALDKDIVTKIAKKVADTSGASPDQVAAAVSSKEVSLGRDFGEDKANELKDLYESLGAKIVIKDLEKPNDDNTYYSTDIEEDDEEDDGRLLTDAEYIKLLNERGDLFFEEKEKKLRIIFPIFFAVFFLLGLYMTLMKLEKIDADFHEKYIKKALVALADVDLTEEEEEPEPEVKKEIEDQKKDLEPKKDKPTKNRSKVRSGGSMTTRLSKQGVLGAMSNGGPEVAGDALGKGGFATGVSAVLAGSGGLAQGGGGSGRGGATTFGFGGGSGGGFSGGSDGASGLDGLMASTSSKAKVTKRGKRKKRTTSKSAKMTGGRSRPSILRVVRRNMTALKYAYNSQLLKTPNLKGKIVVKWAINAAGKVISCKVVSSTINNPAFEEIIRKKISRWKFKRINKPGDVTSITYPFVFQK